MHLLGEFAFTFLDALILSGDQAVLRQDYLVTQEPSQWHALSSVNVSCWNLRPQAFPSPASLNSFACQGRLRFSISAMAKQLLKGCSSRTTQLGPLFKGNSIGTARRRDFSSSSGGKGYDSRTTKNVQLVIYVLQLGL